MQKAHTQRATWVRARQTAVVLSNQHPWAWTASKQEHVLHPLVKTVGKTGSRSIDAQLAHLGFVVQFVDEIFIKSGDYNAISLTFVKWKPQSAGRELQSEGKGRKGMNREMGLLAQYVGKERARGQRPPLLPLNQALSCWRTEGGEEGGRLFHFSFVLDS